MEEETNEVLDESAVETETAEVEEEVVEQKEE